MIKYHDVLLNQLHRLGIDLNAEPENSPWLRLLAVISAAYSDHDERCYAMERALDLASEETSVINGQYQAQLEKINTVSSDGILMTDENWTITSLNARGELLLGVKESSFINEAIPEKLVFLNSQKTPLDFNKLKFHFECGQNYSCSKGVIICNENQSQELFSAFSITPFYLNGSLNGYAISFRDISQDITREYDFRLNEVKKLALIEHSKARKIAWAQSMISNNHNGALAAELKQLSKNKTIDKIQEYILSYVIDSGINASNKILIESFSNHEKSAGFFINALLESMASHIQQIIGTTRFVIENNIHQSVLGHSCHFLEVIYDMITLIVKQFKSGTLTKVTFFPLNDQGLLHPAVSVKIKIDLSYTVPAEFIESNIENIESFLAKSPIDKIAFNYDERSVEIQFDLRFLLTEENLTEKEHDFDKMRCLFYLEENSTLISKMDNAFLLNYIDYTITHNADEVIKKIKEARLSKNEFNVLISDQADFDRLSRHIIQDIVTYINDKFLGLIYVGDSNLNLNLDKDISVYPVKKSHALEEIRQTLYFLAADFMSRSIQRPILEHLQMPDNRRVLFINFEYYAKLLYTQLLVESGVDFCLISPEHLDSKLKASSFDAILVNINNDLNAVLPILKQIKDYWPTTPCCMLLPPGEEKSIAWVLDNGLHDYLFKPFSLADLSSLLQQLLSN